MSQEYVTYESENESADHVWTEDVGDDELLEEVDKLHRIIMEHEGEFDEVPECEHSWCQEGEYGYWFMNPEFEELIKETVQKSKNPEKLKGMVPFLLRAVAHEDDLENEKYERIARKMRDFILWSRTEYKEDKEELKKIEPALSDQFIYDFLEKKHDLYRNLNTYFQG